MYAQGRGGRGPAPQSRRPANVGIPTLPTGQPRSGVGQPSIPAPNERANPRAVTAPDFNSGSRPSLATVQEQIEGKPKLRERLQGMLGNTDVQEAASGYDNLGRLVSTVQVSNNLNIPFEDLKGSVTGEDRVSLGEAIQLHRPELTAEEANRAASAAEEEADELIDEDS